MFDPNHPFYRPLWRRVVIVLVTAVWAVVEYLNDAPVWSLLFAAISGWCAWFLLMVYKDGDTDSENSE